MTRGSSIGVGWRAIGLLLVVICLASGGMRPACASSAERTLLFNVLLDGSSIGEHRFRITEGSAGTQVRSEASFDVKVALIPLYRYRHVAIEQWQQACLHSLQADTDDNGQRSVVRAAAGPDGLRVTAGDGVRSDLAGCVMTYAYWRPAIVRQRALLNAQTGAYEPIQVERLPDSTADTPAGTVPAERYRLLGPGRPIELWYDAAGRWLALETTVAGGRRLRYSLMQETR